MRYGAKNLHLLYAVCRGIVPRGGRRHPHEEAVVGWRGGSRSAGAGRFTKLNTRISVRVYSLDPKSLRTRQFGFVSDGESLIQGYFPIGSDNLRCVEMFAWYVVHKNWTQNSGIYSLISEKYYFYSNHTHLEWNDVLFSLQYPQLLP